MLIHRIPDTAPAATQARGDATGWACTDTLTAGKIFGGAA